MPKGQKANGFRGTAIWRMVGKKRQPPAGFEAGGWAFIATSSRRVA
jgi:hypothetical protein